MLSRVSGAILIIEVASCVYGNHYLAILWWQNFGCQLDVDDELDSDEIANLMNDRPKEV